MTERRAGKVERKRGDQYPPQWLIVVRRNGKIVGGSDTGRLHAYVTREAARACWRAMNANRREVCIVRVLVQEIQSKKRGK